MMGSRGSPDGIEVDALERRSRRALVWARGELRRIKRQFWKRDRRSGRKEVADNAHRT